MPPPARVGGRGIRTAQLTEAASFRYPLCWNGSPAEPQANGVMAPRPAAVQFGVENAPVVCPPRRFGLRHPRACLLLRALRPGLFLRWPSRCCRAVGIAFGLPGCWRHPGIRPGAAPGTASCRECHSPRAAGHGHPPRSSARRSPRHHSAASHSSAASGLKRSRSVLLIQAAPTPAVNHRQPTISQVMAGC